MKNISLVGILVMLLISCGTEQKKIDLSTESGVIDYLSQSDFKQDCYLRDYYKIIRFNKDKTAQLFELDKRTFEITERKNGTVKIGSNRFSDDGESFLYAYIQWTYNPYFANENVYVIQSDGVIIRLDDYEFDSNGLKAPHSQYEGCQTLQTNTELPVTSPK
tara:strand:+ start:109 stop:594 length:486 start_codon:yes stop_codon:yes gene_type:complete